MSSTSRIVIVERTFQSVQRVQAGRPHHKGLTLVEILTALFVLSIGLAGVISIMVRSQQMGIVATDRNNASVIIPEAIKDIERAMLITDNRFDIQGQPSHKGEFMDTADLNDGTTPSNPYASSIQFECIDRRSGARVPFSLQRLAYLIPKDTLSPDPIHNSRDMFLCYWPFNPLYGRVMGQFPQPPGPGTDPLVNNTGPAYRGLFKLEPHPEWVPNPYDRNSGTREVPDSAYAGIYILTFTLYRDLSPEKDLLNFSMEKKLQQVTDPVVVYLRDKKVRQ